jgi:hypothetical protein
MIPLAPGKYDRLTMFSDPWKFYVMDNFLPFNLYNNILNLKNKHNHFRFIDQWENGRVESTETTGFPKKHSIYLHNKPVLKASIADVVCGNLGSLLPNSYFVIPDFVRCEPGYVYPQHKDHKLKYISIVVFLDPLKSCGTIFNHQSERYVVGWRQNRALVFKNDEHGPHSYVNTTDTYRYTLNIYITTDNDEPFKVVNEQTINI